MSQITKHYCDIDMCHNELTEDDLRLEGPTAYGYSSRMNFNLLGKRLAKLDVCNPCKKSLIKAWARELGE